jgi:hypothetical protein
VAWGGLPAAAADVGAVAGVAHQLLGAPPPHESDSADGVLEAARQGARAPLGLLAPAAPRALVTAIEHALEPDPALRPDALAFASALRRSHAAAPVRLTGAVPAAVPGPDLRATHVIRPDPSAPSPAGSTQGSPAAADGARRRRVLLAAGAAGVLAVAAVGGWLSARSGSVQLASVEAATPRPSVGPSWPAILDALDRTRAAAFAAGDPARLTAVYAPGSSLLGADRAAIARLGSAGRRARGVRHTIRDVAPISQDGRTAVLQVVDVLAAYDIVDASGQLVQRTPARSARTFVVRIVNTPAGWRLQEIRSA